VGTQSWERDYADAFDDVSAFGRGGPRRPRRARGDERRSLREFAIDAGASRWIFIAVTGLLAMIFAVVIYQDPKTHGLTVAEALGRGVLVALLTWVSFSRWRVVSKYSCEWSEREVISLR